MDGDNTALSQPGAVKNRSDLVPGASGTPVRTSLYDPASFAEPGNKWGNRAQQFRGPGQWNLDFSSPVGSVRPLPCGVPGASENVLNHSRWANPVTGFSDPTSCGFAARGTRATSSWGFASSSDSDGWTLRPPRSPHQSGRDPHEFCCQATIGATKMSRR